jgi:hypothetical protein
VFRLNPGQFHGHSNSHRVIAGGMAGQHPAQVLIAEYDHGSEIAISGSP